MLIESSMITVLFENFVSSRNWPNQVRVQSNVWFYGILCLFKVFWILHSYGRSAFRSRNIWTASLFHPHKVLGVASRGQKASASAKSCSPLNPSNSLSTICSLHCCNASIALSYNFVSITYRTENNPPMRFWNNSSISCSIPSMSWCQVGTWCIERVLLYCLTKPLMCMQKMVLLRAPLQ